MKQGIPECFVQVHVFLDRWLAPNVERQNLSEIDGNKTQVTRFQVKVTTGTF